MRRPDYIHRPHNTTKIITKWRGPFVSQVMFAMPCIRVSADALDCSCHVSMPWLSTTLHVVQDAKDRERCNEKTKEKPPHFRFYTRCKSRRKAAPQAARLAFPTQRLLYAQRPKGNTMSLMRHGSRLNKTKASILGGCSSWHVPLLSPCESWLCICCKLCKIKSQNTVPLHVQFSA